MEGSMRLSNGVNAHYGEGVYVWSAKTATKTYIDIEVPAGTGVELLEFGNQRWYRLLPESGDVLPVKIVGTDLAAEQLAFYRGFIRE